MAPHTEAAKFLSSDRKGPAAQVDLLGLGPIESKPNVRNFLPDAPVGSAAKLVEAFQEVEQLLRCRSTPSRAESKETSPGELPGLPALQRVTTIQPSPASPLAKVKSAPTLPRPRQVEA